MSLSRLKHFSTLILASTLLLSCRELWQPSGPSEEQPASFSSTIWIDRGPDVGQFDSLTADSKGIPHVSYYDYTLGNLKYAVLNSEKGIWEIQIVDQEGDVGLYTSIATDSHDNPHIVYYDATNDRLKYTFFNGTEWHTAIAFNDHGGLYASLALDAKDVAHISFFSRGFQALHYVKWDILGNGSPIDQTLDSGMGGINGSIESDLSGATSIRIRPDSQEPVIAYYHASQGALQVMRHDPESTNARTQPPAQGWVPDVVDAGLLVGGVKNNVGDFASLFVESESEFHISYYDKTFEDLKYAHWDGERWSTWLVDSEGLVGEWSSITVACKKRPGREAECRPYISYFDSSHNDLKVATLGTDLNWVTFRADLSGVTGTYSSIALVKRGRVGVSYRDFSNSANSGLKFLLFFPF